MSSRAAALVRLGLALLGLALVPPAAAAELRELRVPLRLDPSFVGLLLDAQVFRAPDRTLRLQGPDRCSEAIFSAPAVAIVPGAVRLVSEVDARAGLSLGAGRCLTLVTWQGQLEVDEEPILDAPAQAVRFRIVRSALRPREASLLPQERLWGWIGPALHPHLETLRVELGPALDDVRRVLPLFARPADAPAADRLAASLAPAAARAEADALVIEVRLEVEASPEPSTPEPDLDARELAAVRRSLRRLDAFVTFVVKQAGRDALAPAVRRELLELLLDARHELVAALADPAPHGEDAVQAVFRHTWERLAPLLRQIDGDLPMDGALRYLSFIAAGDALAAVSAAAPAFGLELSRDGLRRLARTIAPAASGDPLERSREVDPELREIFGFGAPLPPPSPPPLPDELELPEPAPDPAPAPLPDPPPAPLPDPPAVPAPDPPPAPAPDPPPAPESRRAPLLERALAVLFAAPASAASLPGGEDRAALAKRLNRWSPSRKDIAVYRPLAGRLLDGIAGDVHAGSDLGPERRALFRSLALAAAWQESCWRQYVRSGAKLVPLRSTTGDVGIMQVNERVWRGFYALQGLRWDVAYNARAGDEILLRYLEDFAIPRQPKGADDLEALARATYAMYNGGPSAARRWRAAKAVEADVGFAEKLGAIRAGRESKVESCYTG
jgi:hypothetical protein